MAKKSLLDKIAGKKAPQKNANVNNSSDAKGQDLAGEVDHLWMKEDIDAKKPKAMRNPKIDTEILKNRIAEKIAKMNNH